jgi:DNA-binding transcriptional LysR family regulator
MDLHTLECFLTIAREKSITKAAQRLHISQPALTAKIKRMETEIGVKLLERSRQGVELTTEGSRFLSKALKMSHEYNLIYEDISNNVWDFNQSRESKLRIGINRSLVPTLFPSILRKLNEYNPDLMYDLRLEFTKMVIDLLLFNDLDIGIIKDYGQHEGLFYHPLYKDKLVLIGPKEDPALDENRLINKNILLNEPFILYDYSVPIRGDIDKILIKFLGGKPSKIQEANDTNAILSMVESGFGYSILPLSFIKDPTTPEIKEISAAQPFHLKEPSQCRFRVIDLGEFTNPQNIYLVYSKERAKDKSVVELSEYLAVPHTLRKTIDWVEEI